MADYYRDFLDESIGKYFRKLKKTLHSYTVVSKYTGKNTKRIELLEQKGKGIAYNNYLLTCGHIVMLPEEIVLSFEEKKKKYKDKFMLDDMIIVGLDDVGVPIEYKLKVSKKDPDIAILKYPVFVPEHIRQNYKDSVVYRMSRIKKLGDSDKIEAGDFIFAIKTPALIEPMYDEGKITSSTIPDNVKLENKESYFLHTIETFPGDSSDPIFALYKTPELIGLITGNVTVTLKDKRQLNLPYAVKINEFKKYL